MPEITDAMVAEKCMGWKLVPRGDRNWACESEMGWKIPGQGDDLRCADCIGVPSYTSNIASAFQVVERVQEMHPGWRFALLGGDGTMGYYANPDGSIKRDGNGEPVVSENEPLQPFGWKAEFFGESDPRKDYGDRHGTASADTPAEAICKAAIAAIEEEPCQR